MHGVVVPVVPPADGARHFHHHPPMLVRPQTAQPPGAPQPAQSGQGSPG
jgi:hypothetical protein